MLIEQTVQCPYCGQRYSSSIDVTSVGQEYIEDCYACCRPITIRVRINPIGGLEGIEIRRDDD